MTDTPNRGIPYVPEGTLDPAAGLNLSLNVIDALLQCAVISMSQTGPPITSADGDLYIVASPADSGDWSGLEDHLVRFVAEGSFWQSYTPGTQVSLVLNKEDGLLYRYDDTISPAAWILAAGLGDAPVDGVFYGRKDGEWETGSEGIVIQDDDSPPTEVISPATALIVGAGLTLTEPMPGIAHIEAVFGGIPSLAEEILADSPLGYWKLDEASGDFADSSGNGRTMTAVGSPSYRYASIVPRETARFVYFDATGDRASRADASGLAMPANGDWTIELIAIVESVTTNATLFFSIGGVGETEATNYQILWRPQATTGSVDMFWEFGAGTNLTAAPRFCNAVPLFMPAHYAAVKDGTANTVSFYKNGILTDVIAYANEPTGGSSVTSEIHGDSAGGTANPAVMAHVALYNTALSQARIRAHAQAAGFLAPD